MTLHREIALEDSICSHLAQHGWLYDPDAARNHDRARALFPDDLIAWIKDTQPQTWDALTTIHGPASAAVVLDRLRATLDRQGTLPTLRNGLEIVGLRQPITLCQFRPAFGTNAELQQRYAANRLRVARQVRYATANENSLDLVLYLNGMPVATAELKSDYTQSVADAVDQYRHDRVPRSAAEPMLGFPGGPLVHFAVSNSEVRMCTRLEGAASTFLPFNKGHDLGAGNPPNPNGAPTAYLWEDVWQRDSWLDIIGRYVVAVRDDKKRLRNWIFPRFHQLDATRKLLAQMRADGPGGRYLIQHSAGSGKTNSIAWTAHFLADLHDAADRKLFDTVLVVSDRTVLDRQLREAIEDFQRTSGVVAVVTGDDAAKSRELAQALADGKKIVVCTIQTFPHAIQEVRRLAATQGKRFVVIADEAHSSQTGRTATKLKSVLSPEERAALDDGGDVDIEDLLAAEMATRARQDAGISYVAFTATPKARTLELFGRRPTPDAVPEAFHVYSMRQAIEEGFILDVLRNYTSYKLAFRLTHDGRELTEREVDAAEARKGIMGWVRLHPANIAARVQIVVEHFRQTVAHLLGGQAKAMVVTATRKEAVRWAKAMEAYIKRQGYPIGLLVAFSGEVNDPETGPDAFTETNMNLGLRGRDIREAFRGPEYSILIVANKFQTGFDQPLLCAMYVDRKLGGIQAVQTLSRLNRAYPGKDATYVVDFVNDPEDVLAAFRQYYTTAELADVSDPNVVLDLRAKLEATGFFDRFEMDRVAKVAVKPKATQAELDAAITPISMRLLTRFKIARDHWQAEPEGSPAQKSAKDEMDALILFKADLGTYARMYEFLGQMFDYGNTDYEKLYLFAKLLLPLLTYGREREGVDLSALRLTHHRMRDLGQRRLNLVGDEAPEKLKPVTDAGSGQIQDRHRQRLDEIIAGLSGLFGEGLTEGDAVSWLEGVERKMLESPVLRAQAVANTKEQFAHSPTLPDELMNAVMDSMAANQTMSRQALDSDTIRTALLATLLGPGALWESLRQAGGTARPT